MGIASSDSELVFFRADFKTCPAFFNYKCVDAFVFFLFVGLGDYQIIICAAAVGNPVFCAVQYVMVAVFNGCRFLRSGIATSFGLAQTKCAKFFASGEFGKIFLFLFFSAILFKAVTNQ